MIKGALMNYGVKTIIYPVKDLAKAKALYTKLLGVQPYAEQPYYVGFRVGDQEIGLDPNGHRKGMTGATAYCHVSDITECLKSLLDAWVHTQQVVTDVGKGKLIATVKDADDNMIGLIQSP